MGKIVFIPGVGIIELRYSYYVCIRRAKTESVVEMVAGNMTFSAFFLSSVVVSY